MSGFLPLLTQIVLAQALGVGLAWRVEAASWKWRRDEEFVASFNILSVILLLCWSLFTPWTDQVLPVAICVFWLLILAGVQSRQCRCRFGDAFFGAMMQFICFAVALLLGVVVSLVLGGFVFVLVYLVSAALFHALLSLFRPTIYGAWNTWRQNSGKNRRVR